MEVRKKVMREETVTSFKCDSCEKEMNYWKYKLEKDVDYDPDFDEHWEFCSLECLKKFTEQISPEGRGS